MRIFTPKIVGNLTARLRWRHSADADRHLSGIAATVTLLANLLAGDSIAATTHQWQATEQIAATAETYIQTRIGAAAGRTTAKAAMLDSRHHMANCDQPLKAFLRRGAEIKARTIVGVRCSGSKPWKVYVPVDVIVTATVLVSRQTLPRGHELNANDLVEEQRDVSRLLTGYVSDKKQVQGQHLKTQLIAGKILTPRMLEASIAIRRGQTVTLTTDNGSIRISMSGKALMDGALNQRIRVENLGSGRIVEGIVRSREHVEVLVSGNKHFFHAEPKVSPKVADRGFSNNDR